MRIATGAVGIVTLLVGLTSPGLAQPVSDLLITPGTGIGPITLGQTVTQVIGILGTPTLTYNVGEGVTLYAWLDNKQGGPGHRAGRGIAIAANATTLVVQVQAYYDARYQTANGLHVGMTPAQIRSILGEPARVRSESDGYSLVYPSRGIEFHVATNPQVDGYQTVIWITVFPRQRG